MKEHVILDSKSKQCPDGLMLDNMKERFDTRFLRVAFSNESGLESLYFSIGSVLDREDSPTSYGLLSTW